MPLADRSTEICPPHVRVYAATIANQPALCFALGYFGFFAGLDLEFVAFFLDVTHGQALQSASVSWYPGASSPIFPSIAVQFINPIIIRGLWRCRGEVFSRDLFV